MKNNIVNERNEFLQDDGQIRVFIVPVDILDVPDLSTSEKMVYMVLRSFVKPTDPTAFPSYETIAKKASLKRRRTIDVVKSLVEKGLIHKETRLDVSKNRKIRNTSNLYTLVTPKRQASAPKREKIMKKSPSANIAPPPVQSLHHPSANIAPYHNHLTEPLRTNDCLYDAREELACAAESIDSEKEIYETLQTEVPKNCYVQGMPLGQAYIAEIFLMLANQFKNQLSPQVVKTACRLYFSRACEFSINGISMLMDIKNPVGFFQNCYKDAIRHYKVTSARA